MHERRNCFDSLVPGKIKNQKFDNHSYTELKLLDYALRRCKVRILKRKGSQTCVTMQASYPPPPAPSTSQCVTRVQLNISCRNLRDKDVMSKSDPMAVVMIFKDGNWSEVRSSLS